MAHRPRLPPPTPKRSLPSPTFAGDRVGARSHGDCAAGSCHRPLPRSPLAAGQQWDCDRCAGQPDCVGSSGGISVGFRGDRSARGGLLGGTLRRSGKLAAIATHRDRGRNIPHRRENPTPGSVGRGTLSGQDHPWRNAASARSGCVCPRQRRIGRAPSQPSPVAPPSHCPHRLCHHRTPPRRRANPPPPLHPPRHHRGTLCPTPRRSRSDPHRPSRSITRGRHHLGSVRLAVPEPSPLPAIARHGDAVAGATPAAGWRGGGGTAEQGQ